jgi:hypothetical protein
MKDRAGLNCAIAEEWGKLTGQSRGLNPIRRNQSRMVETIILKRTITKGSNLEHRGPTVFSCVLHLSAEIKNAWN